jgi:hypothetical protein
MLGGFGVMVSLVQVGLFIATYGLLTNTSYYVLEALVLLSIYFVGSLKEVLCFTRSKCQRTTSR